MFELGLNLNPPNCVPLLNTQTTLTLVFPSSLPGRSCIIPEYRSDPAYFPGSRSKDQDKTTYFCKISITPDYQIDDCKADYDVNWDVFSYDKQINIPDNRSFSITVDFWERCENVCNGTRFEDTRARYTSTNNLYSQSFIFAYLNYQGQEYICN